jgi:hypothetical protein
MITISLDTMIFAISYTILVGGISFFYNVMGYREGIVDAVESIKRFEPQAVERALYKMRVEEK